MLEHKVTEQCRLLSHLKAHFFDGASIWIFAVVYFWQLVKMPKQNIAWKFSLTSSCQLLTDLHFIDFAALAGAAERLMSFWKERGSLLLRFKSIICFILPVMSHGQQACTICAEMIKAGKKLPETFTSEQSHEPFTYTAKQFRHMDGFIKYKPQQVSCLWWS